MYTLLALTAFAALTAALGTALYLAYLETATDFPLKPRYRRHSAVHY